MRIVKFLAAGAVALTSASAVAADFGDVEPLAVPDAVAAEPANDWSGFYLGALLGYTWGEAESGEFADVESDGIEGGGYLGANWQLGNFVLGAEGDVLASAVEGDDDGLSAEQGLNGSLRGRAGIALDQFLLYGTAGLAVTEAEVTGGGDRDDATLLGWTAGAGAETMLTDSITARVEYRYSDYEDETFTLGGDEGNGDFATSTVRAGVGFKF